MSSNNKANIPKSEESDIAKYHSRGPEYKKDKEKTKENGKEKFKD